MTRYKGIDISGVKFKKVKSSIIDSVAYRDGTMYVIFNNKSLYAYFDVPSYEYDNMLKSSSIGSYLKKNLSSYNYKKYENDEDNDR